MNRIDQADQANPAATRVIQANPGNPEGNVNAGDVLRNRDDVILHVTDQDLLVITKEIGPV